MTPRCGIADEHRPEVLSPGASSDKLLSAETVKRQEFEDTLRARLRKIEGAP